MSQLPDTLSALILVALADLEAVEKSDTYVVNMGQWHSPSLNAGPKGQLQCRVCFAGAVMAQTLGEHPGSYVSIGAFGDDIGKLTALDTLRYGDLEAALYEFYCHGHEKNARLEEKATLIIAAILETGYYPSPAIYSGDPERFKTDMRELAERLATVEATVKT